MVTKDYQGLKNPTGGTREAKTPARRFVPRGLTARYPVDGDTSALIGQFVVATAVDAMVNPS